MYAVGSGSIAYFLTANAPNACASVIKYVFSEFRSELNKIASAFGDTPVTFPGNNITGTLTVDFISATVLLDLSLCHFPHKWDVVLKFNATKILIPRKLYKFV